MIFVLCSFLFEGFINHSQPAFNFTNSLLATSTKILSLFVSTFIVNRSNSQHPHALDERLHDWFLQGSFHSHFVHSISNSMVNHFDIGSINAHYCLYQLFDDKTAPYLTSNIKYIAFLSSNNRYKKISALI